MSSAIPLTVLTGFLGSGKTTLLKRLLHDPAMAGTAVIINEFGDVGLDHALVEKTEEDAILLQSGCVCCQLRGDLTVALAKLHRQSMHGDIPVLKRIVLETTGLADPTPIVHTLMTDEDTYRIYQLDGVVTTVDAEHGLRQLDHHFEPAKQIAIADRIVLTKTDRATKADIAALERRIRALNRSVEIDHAVLGDIAHTRLFGLGAHEVALVGTDARKWLAIDAVAPDQVKSPTPNHVHDHTCGPSCGHDDGHQHHDPAHLHGIDSYALTFDTELDGNSLSLGLQTMASAYGDRLLRVKGIVTVAGQGRPFVVHGVQHIFYPPDTLKDWPKGPDGQLDKRSRFVFITKDLPRATVVKHLKPFLGDPVA
jgi:G3E family GTPase